MKQKYLIVKGAAGLGNRLITLITAITYAKQTKRKLIVDWTDGQFAKKGENAFYKCFELMNIAHFEKVSAINEIEKLTIYPLAWKEFIHDHRQNFRYLFVFPSVAKLFQSLGIRGAIGKIAGFWEIRKATSRKYSLLKKIGATLSSKTFPHGSSFSYSRSEDIVVYVDFQPFNFMVEDFFEHVRLKPEIAEKIDHLQRKHAMRKNSVGIHVRCTDKKPTRSIATLVNKVKKLNLVDPVIFLATDNAQIIESLRGYFPKLITLNEDIPLPPAPGKGIHHHFTDTLTYDLYESGILDMWLLSKCEYLLYQGNSSFSLFSKYLHSDKSKVVDWMADE